MHHGFDIARFENAPDFSEKLAGLKAQPDYFISEFENAAASPESNLHFLKYEASGARRSH